MKNKKLKNDIILVSAILLSAVIAFLALYLFSDKGDKVVVMVDGEAIAEYSLSDERTEKIKTEYGENTLVIKDGYADITEADCKNQICVHTHKIKYGGETITCLPHKLTVIIDGENNIDIMQ